MSWLDDLAAAEARGAHGNSYVSSLHCDCPICVYRSQNHDLTEKR